MKKIKNNIKKYLTAGRGGVDFQPSREILTRQRRDITCGILDNQKAPKQVRDLLERRPVGSNHIRSSRTKRLSSADRNRPASASGDLRTVHFNTKTIKNNLFHKEEVVSGPVRKDVTTLDNQVHDSKSAEVVKTPGVDNQKAAETAALGGLK